MNSTREAHRTKKKKTDPAAVTPGPDRSKQRQGAARAADGLEEAERDAPSQKEVVCGIDKRGSKKEKGARPRRSECHAMLKKECAASAKTARIGSPIQKKGGRSSTELKKKPSQKEGEKRKERARQRYSGKKKGQTPGMSGTTKKKNPALQKQTKRRVPSKSRSPKKAKKR